MQLVSEYYKEKVLSLDKNDRKLVEFPYNFDDTSIEKDLFSWKLISGKQFIECSCEEEAKYLDVFIKAGRREVFVPKNADYLKEILPQLLHLKKRHDEIIEDKVDGLLSRRLQEQARRLIWRKVFRGIEEAEEALVEEVMR